jgi:hypothetical protein
MKRKGKFQAFPEHLHDIALIRYKVREGILQKDGCKGLFKFKNGVEPMWTENNKNVFFTQVCSFLHRYSEYL